MKEAFREIQVVVNSFKNSLQKNLSTIEAGIKELIQSKSTDKKPIGNSLDILLSLINFGVGNDLYIQLLAYYNTVNANGAAFYWNEYDTKNED